MIVSSYKDLGTEAKKARGYTLTQCAVAKNSGWSQTAVKNLEICSGHVSFVCAEEIFQSLGYKLTYILERNNERKEDEFNKA